MAIIQCQECDGQVSDTAKACPHCGAKRGGSGNWLKTVAITLAVLIAILLVLVAMAPPVDPAKAKEREVIARCWDEQSRKSLSPDTQRFVASACEKFEDDYRTKYGSKP